MPKSDFNKVAQQLYSQGAEGAKVDNSGDKLWPMPYDRVAYLVSKSTRWTCWKNWFAHILQTGIYRPVPLEKKMENVGSL